MKLYVIAGSHPCFTAEAALRLKGLDYRRVELPHQLHRVIMRRKFGGPAVPAMVLDDGEKVQGSRAILRRIDELEHDPPFYPTAEVEEAERWGDEVFQNAVRRIEIAAQLRRPESMPTYTRGSRFAAPAALEKRVGPLVMRAGVKFHGITDARVREDLAAFPGHLDRIDEWIRSGVMGGEQPNAADLQIGSSLKAISTIGDMEPLLRGRPALALGERLFPDLVGSCPAGALPASWLPRPEDHAADPTSVHSRTDPSVR